MSTTSVANPVPYAKPLPYVDESSRAFWDAAKRHEFVLWHCRSCGKYYFPATVCHCRPDPDMGWDRASGRGSLYSWTVFQQPYHPAFVGDLPYNVGLVKLEEGCFFITNVVGCANDDLLVGLPLDVTFDDVTDEVTLVKFKPAK